jgi:DHA2 family multidrug resistance protein
MVPTPVINLRLFLTKNFALGLLLIVAFSFTQQGPNYILPQYALQVQGYREAQIGAILIWLAIPPLLLSPLAALSLLALDARVVLAFGLALFVSGAGLTLHMTSEWVGADLLPGLAIQACAFPFILVPNLQISTSSLQLQDAPSAGALFNIVRTLAGSAAAAITGAVITIRERVHDALLLTHVPAGAVPDAMAGEVAARARTQAFVLAYADTYGLIALIALAAILLVLLAGDARLFPRPANNGVARRT